MDPGIIIAALAQLRLWLSDWSSSDKQRHQNENEAIRILLSALTKTHIYLGDLDMQAQHSIAVPPEVDRERQTELALAWSDAAGAFSGDPAVAPLLQLKSQAWANPGVWNDERVRRQGITIQEMSDLAQRLLADQ
jgi:hypothetical protein